MLLIVYGTELLFAEALSTLLDRRGHTVVACPAFPAELIEVAKSETADVCLVDVTSSADIAAISQIKASVPSLPVVILNPETDPNLLAGAVSAGANGVCLKVDGISEIERVLVRTRERYERGELEPMWSLGASSAMKRESTMAKGMRLTPKETAVLELLIAGTSTALIADKLGVSDATVRTHLQHLFGKFGVHSRIALIAAAVHAGRGLGAESRLVSQ